MNQCMHDGPDGITVARVSGTMWRHATKLANPANGHTTLEAGVAELRAITTDPHLLAHGATASDEWYHDSARELLIAAGADADMMDQLRAELDRRRQRGDLLSQLAARLSDTAGDMRAR